MLVPLYAYKKKRMELFWECLVGEALYLGLVGLAVWATPVTAIWVLIVPFFITSLALMFGNW